VRSVLTFLAESKPYGKVIIGAVARGSRTTVTRIPLSAFKGAIEDHPKALNQLVRVVARRLQRITFLVMYRFVVSLHMCLLTRVQISGPGLGAGAATRHGRQGTLSFLRLPVLSTAG
jgi:hypothetical protein